MDCFLTADDTIRDVINMNHALQQRGAFRGIVFVNGTRVEVQDNREFNGTYGVGKQFRFSLPSLQFRIGIHAENGLTFSLPPSQVPSQAPTYPSSSPTAFPTQAPHPLSCSNKIRLGVLGYGMPWVPVSSGFRSRVVVWVPVESRSVKISDLVTFNYIEMEEKNIYKLVRVMRKTSVKGMTEL
eukprot:1351428-Amorphochlora_amoeboformis.AAC.1